MAAKAEALQEIKRLRGTIHNVKPRDIERVALMAGVELVRTKGGHFHYAKPDYPPIVSIPQHTKVSPGVARDNPKTIEKWL